MGRFWGGLFSQLSFFFSRSERRLERWRREERWREEERLQQIQREIKEAEKRMEKMKKKQEERKKREERRMILQEEKRRRQQEIAERQKMEELIRQRRSMILEELHLKYQREKEELLQLRKLEEELHIKMHREREELLRLRKLEEELHLKMHREREELLRLRKLRRVARKEAQVQQKCLRDLALPSTTSTRPAEPEDQQNQVADCLKAAFRSYMEALRPVPLENTRRTLDSIEMKLMELQIRVAGGVAGPIEETIEQ